MSSDADIGKGNRSGKASYSQVSLNENPRYASSNHFCLVRKIVASMGLRGTVQTGCAASATNANQDLLVRSIMRLVFGKISPEPHFPGFQCLEFFQFGCFISENSD
jgi:hypothetical protein